MFYIFLKPKNFRVNLSFDCVLRFSSVASSVLEVVGLSMRGDVESMKDEFGSGEASPFDVLPNGSTLLDVRIRHCPKKAAADSR